MKVGPSRSTQGLSCLAQRNELSFWNQKSSHPQSENRHIPNPKIVTSPTKWISKTENRYIPHTAAESDISSHTYSNSILLNSGTNECFIFHSFCESQRFPLNILKVGLSREIPIEIDQNVKIQKTPWLILFIENSFTASPLHRREENQDCTIIWYKKSMFGFEMTRYSEYLGINSNHRSLLGLTVIHDYP